DVGLGADCRNAWGAPNEANIADVVALVEDGDDALVALFVVDDDVDVAPADDEQLVAEGALAAEDLAGRPLGVEQQAGRLFENLGRQAGERLQLAEATNGLPCAADRGVAELVLDKL